jgi:hypothetical protein
MHMHATGRPPTPGNGYKGKNTASMLKAAVIAALLQMGTAVHDTRVVLHHGWHGAHNQV